MKPMLLLLLAIAPAFAQELVTIEVDAELPVQEFLDRMSERTGKPLLYDPASQRIRGQKMGASFAHSVPKDRLFDTVRAILSFFELTLVPVGPEGHEVYLVIDSRSTNSSVRNKATYVDHEELAKYADRDGLYICTVIPVADIENTTLLRTALSTLVTPAGIGRVHEIQETRALVVMDFAPAVASIARLVERMKPGGDGRKPVLALLELRHAEAPLVAATLTRALAEQEGVRGPRIVPYEPRNALVVSSTKAELEAIRALVKDLDRPAVRRAVAD